MPDYITLLHEDEREKERGGVQLSTLKSVARLLNSRSLT